MIAEPAGVERRRHERRTERVHLHERRQVPRVPEVERIETLRQARARGRLHGDDTNPAVFSKRAPDEREGEPREVRPPSRAADHDVRIVLGELHLGARLLSDDGLVHEDVVQDRAEGVLRVLARRRGLDRLGDRHAEAARRVGVFSEDRASRVRLVGGTRHHTRAVRLDQPAPVRLLVVRDPDHVDLDLEAEDSTRECKCRAPLAGPGLGRQARDALLLRVERLRHCGVRLVRPRGRDALVLVVDARRGLERLFQSARAIERRRAPLAIHRSHLFRDREEAVGRDLLLDDLQREERREVVGPDRLSGARMEHRRRRLREVGGEVVPGLRQAGLVEDVLHRVAHALPLVGGGCGKCRGRRRRGQAVGSAADGGALDAGGSRGRLVSRASGADGGARLGGPRANCARRPGRRGEGGRAPSLTREAHGSRADRSAVGFRAAPSSS